MQSPQLSMHKMSSKSVHSFFRYLAEMQKSSENPVPRFGLWSGSSLKVNQYVHVLTSIDTQYLIHARVLSDLANRQTDRQTDKRTRAKTYTSSFVGGKKNNDMITKPLPVYLISFTFITISVTVTNKYTKLQHRSKHSDQRHHLIGLVIMIVIPINYLQLLLAF